MKKILALILAIVMAFSTVIPVIAEEAVEAFEEIMPMNAPIRGMINADGLLEWYAPAGFFCSGRVMSHGSGNEAPFTLYFSRVRDTTHWGLVYEVEGAKYDETTYACPACGSNSWTSFSNNSGVPDGNNLNLDHFIPDDGTPVTVVSIYKYIHDWGINPEDNDVFEFRVFTENDVAVNGGNNALIRVYNEVYSETFNPSLAEGRYYIVETNSGSYAPNNTRIYFNVNELGFVAFEGLDEFGMTLDYFINIVDDPFGELLVEVEIDQQNYNQPWRNTYNQPWRNVYNQPWRNVYNQGWRNVYNQPWLNEYNQPWRNIYNQPWQNEYNQEWRNVYNQPWQNEYNQTWRNVYNQPWQNEYNQTWRNVYNQSWRNVYDQEWRNVYDQPWRNIAQQDWRKVYEQDWRNIIVPEYSRDAVQQGPYTGIHNSNVNGRPGWTHSFLGSGGNANTLLGIRTADIMGIENKQWIVLGQPNPNNHRIEENHYGYYVYIDAASNEFVILFDNRFVNANMRAAVYFGAPTSINVANNRHFNTGDAFRIPLPAIPSAAPAPAPASAPVVAPAATATARMVGNGNNATLSITVGGITYEKQPWSNNSTRNYTLGGFVVEVRIQGNGVNSVKVLSAPAAPAPAPAAPAPVAVSAPVIPNMIYLHSFVSSIRYMTDYTFRGWKVVGNENVDPRRNVGKDITIGVGDDAVDIVGELVGSPRIIGKEDVAPRTLIGPEDVGDKTLIGPEDVEPRTLIGPEDVDDNVLIGPVDVAPKTIIGPEDVDDKVLIGPVDVGEKSLIGPEDVGEKSLIGPVDVGEKTLIGSEDVGEKTFIRSVDIAPKTLIGQEDVGEKTLIGQEDVGEKTLIGQEDVGNKTLIGPEDVDNATPAGAPVPYTGELTLTISGGTLDAPITRLVSGGRFNEIFDLEAGVYTVTLSGVGFETVSFERTVVAAETATVKFTDIVDGETFRGAANQQPDLDIRGAANQQPDSIIRGAANQLPDSVIRGEGNKLPDLDIRGEANQLPDVIIRGEANQLPDEIIRGEENQIEDLIIRGEENQIEDLIIRGEENQLEDLIIRGEANQLPDKDIRGEENQLDDVIIRGDDNQLPDRDIRGEENQLDDVIIRGDDNQLPDRDVRGKDNKVDDRIIEGNQLPERVTRIKIADRTSCEDCSDKKAPALNAAVAAGTPVRNVVCACTIIRN